MKYKGRRQSDNVEDMRGSRSRSIGLKGGLIGTLAIALVVYLLGGNPLDVLQMRQGQTETVTEDVPLSEKEQEMSEFVSVVLGDTEEVWGKIFQQYGSTYREPKLVLYRSAVNSACGYAQAATGPFYCPGDEKVYLDLDYLEALQRKLGATGDFAVAYIIAHEVGHHVQKLMGTMNEVTAAQNRARSQSQRNELTVRLELQADFFAGVWIHHAQKMFNILEEGDLEEALNAASAVGDDRIQKQTQGYVVPDSFTHGTSAQRKSWLAKGIRTGDIRQGDTFGANI
ncbi:MAG TPA: neutral zinc metallopeptidase [Prolixibacteraceae bacterium]|nr:metalloprotease [Bacteroidales bacterium]HOY92083.1 neutral zinc metallopeptidase [Prolixibacteraceae bacterium]